MSARTHNRPPFKDSELNPHALSSAISSETSKWSGVLTSNLFLSTELVGVIRQSRIFSI